MGKLVTVFLLTALLGALANGRVITMPEASSANSEMPQLLQRNVYADFFNFGIYVHEIGTGPNQTVWNVAFTENTLTSPSSFGLIQVIDNPFTSRPELDSLPLGRVQGTVSFADLRETALSVNLNFIFTEETFFKGSTLSVQGRLPASEIRSRELSVVGGTGNFSMAQGIAFSSRFSFDPSTLRRVSSYSLFFTTPDMILSQGISST